MRNLPQHPGPALGGTDQLHRDLAAPGRQLHVRRGRAQAARIALAGSQSTSVSAFPGELWLAFNDGAYSGGTAGNSGQVTVTITVTRA